MRPALGRFHVRCIQREQGAAEGVSAPQAELFRPNEPSPAWLLRQESTPELPQAKSWGRKAVLRVNAPLLDSRSNAIDRQHVGGDAIIDTVRH